MICIKHILLMQWQRTSTTEAMALVIIPIVVWVFEQIKTMYVYCGLS